MSGEHSFSQLIRFSIRCRTELTFQVAMRIGPQDFFQVGFLQIEKLVPQPQEAVALGLLTRNEAPIRSSTKSTSEPARNGTDAGSTNTTALSREITRSSSARARSTSNLYWKPEQPPPSTLMRSMAPSPSVLRISPMRRAARSLMVTAVVMRRLRRPACYQIVWYPAPSIVKCARGWNQTFKGINTPCRSEWLLLARPMPATPTAAADGCSPSRRAGPAARFDAIATA